MRFQLWPVRHGVERGDAMRVNGVLRTLTMCRFEDEGSRGTAGKAFGGPGIAGRNPLLGVASGCLVETLLLEKKGPRNDCCNWHDRFDAHRAPKHPLAQVPLASPWVTA